MGKDSLISLIKADVFRYSANVSWKYVLWSYWNIPGCKYMIWHRLTAYFKERSFLLFVFCRWRLNRLSIRYGIQIPYATSIGKGFYIGHFSCIVVSPCCSIGQNVNISQGVTLGKTYGGKKTGAPKIGNEVYIGPGVKIIGNITIGNNVAIGANAVVTKDLPDNAVAVGIPAKIISYNGASDYINNKL